MEQYLKNIQWLGHASFKIIADAKTILIDPFKLKKDEPCDIVCSTHDHFDHCSPEDIQRCCNEETLLVGPDACMEKLKGNKKSLNVGEKINVKGIEIEAVPAYNTNKSFHPQQAKGVGFIFRFKNYSLYHAGDTDHIEEMKDITADIALLPVSGTYVMTADEAAQAALDIRPKVAIPMHFGDIVGDLNDANRFKELLAGKIKVVIPKLEE
ncbi:MBL fold metallo-hydrolase [Candidatus Riflebacteria bacterium]